MASGKWIGGFLGFITGGPLGALAGFALGWLFDQGIDSVNVADMQGQGKADSFGQSGRYRQQMQEGQFFSVQSACLGSLYHQGRRESHAF